MASMTFQINDAGGVAPAVWVTVTQNSDGTLRFDMKVEGSYTGDLRGLFFDLADESLINTLQVVPVTDGFTELQVGNDSVTNLGGGSNMNGLLGSTDTAGYDVGIEIGTSGIGKDDYQSFSFVLDSTARDLTLADVSNVDFGVRLTSVGEEDGSRNDSSKILEVTSTAITASDDVAAVGENQVASGNVLTNDMAGLPATDSVSVTGWSGGTLGEATVLTNAEGATLTLNADGSYVLDAGAADRLSQGEHLEYSFTYDAKALNEATSWSADSGVFTVSVDGVNDGPVAQNDDAGTIAESASISGNVLANDYDIDRLDTIQVAAVNGQEMGADGTTAFTLASGATVTIAADGTYTYDTNGAFDGLVDGEQATDSFEYTITDNNGATATATVSLRIDGAGGSDPQGPGGPDGPELSSLGLSHGYWKTHDGNPNPDDWNIAHDTDFEAFFGVDAGTWTVGTGQNRMTLDDIMFDEALELNGGDKYALAREAVTAVLNATDEKNGTVYDFAYSVDEVRTMVHDALASNDAALIESTKDLLEASHD